MTNVQGAKNLISEKDFNFQISLRIIDLAFSNSVNLSKRCHGQKILEIQTDLINVFCMKLIKIF